MAGLEDRKRLEGIRNDRLRRLRILEKRQAIEGFNTPAEVILEIEQIRRDLGLMEAVISSPVSQEAVDAVGAGGQYVALDKKLDQVIDFLSERMDRMEEHSGEWRMSERAARIEGQHGNRLTARVTLVISGSALLVSVVALVLTVIIAIKVF